jgi:IS5 family transposase
MPEAMSQANGRRSKIRSAVEHVFARQKDKMKLFIRNIGIKRATVKIGMANIANNCSAMSSMKANAQQRDA